MQKKTNFFLYEWELIYHIIPYTFKGESKEMIRDEDFEDKLSVNNDLTEQSNINKSKSTIYVAVPVPENKRPKCPHCNKKITINRRENIIMCPECFEYMHVVFIIKNKPESKAKSAK